MAEAAQIDDSMSTLVQREQELAKLLKEGSRDELERDAGILKEMGEVYYKRGLLTKDVDNFVKSSALINAALLRTQEKRLVRNLKNLLEKTELAFFKALSLTPEKTPSAFTADVKSKLREIRKTIGGKVEKLLNEIERNYSVDVSDSKRISSEKEFIEKTRLICGETSTAMSDLFRFLLLESEKLLGTPSQEYAVIGLGSLARGETTPYSDIEWAILIEDESKDIGYFRNLARLVHLFVLNIQETLLKSLAIKSLNDYDTPGGNWFVDSVAPRGFQFDSAAPYASNTPLGRPDYITKEGLTKEGRELIRTPQHMAQLCDFNTARKVGYNIDRIMTSVVKIGGSRSADKLVSEFISARAQVKSNLMVRVKASSEILQVLSEFMPNLNFHKPSKTVRDIKQSMFRLPTLVVTLFKSCFGLNACTTWDVLEEMVSKNILPGNAAHNLKCVVSIAALLRLYTYLKKKCQDELISLLPQEHPSGDRESVTHLENWTVLVARYYSTMLALRDFICSVDFVWLALDGEKPMNSFYESSDHVRGIIELNSCRYEQARGHFFNYLDTKRLQLGTENNNNLKEDTYGDRTVIYDETDKEVQECFNVISRTYVYEGNWYLALKYSKIALEMCSTCHCDPHKEPECYVLVASSYSELHKHEKALDYYLLALSSLKALHGGADCEEVAVVLDNIAAVYTETGKLSEALEYSDASLSMIKRVYGDKDHPHLMKTLSNRANVYSRMGNLAEALSYCKDAIEMSRRLHGTGVHPDISGLFENIALVYFKLFAMDLALHYFLEQMAVLQRFYARNHPQSAFMWGWIETTKLCKRKLSDYDTCIPFMEDTIKEDDVFESTKLQYPRDPQDMKTSLIDYENVSPVVVADILCFVGIALSFSGKAEQALSYQLAALEMKEEIFLDNNSNKSIAVSLWNVGKIFCDMREYDKSLKYLSQSLEMQRRVNKGRSSLNIAICLNAIMRVYIAKKEWDIALKYGKEATEMVEEVGHPLYAPQYNMDLGIVYANKGSLRSAIETLNLALRLARTKHGSCDHFIGICLNNLGAVYIMMRRHQDACQFLMKSLRMKRRLVGEGDHRGIAKTLNNVGMAYSRMGQLDLATQFHRDALNMRHRLYGDQNHSEYRASRRRLDRVKCRIRKRES